MSRRPDPLGELRSAQRRALWLSLGANGIFMIAEVVGGVIFGSLALLADAAHMLSDVAGLGVALVAQTLLGRPASGRHTYGLQRAEVLGAQANGLTLTAAAGWIFYEAARRISDPRPIAARGLIIVAALGFAVNVWSAWLLARSRGRSVNMRGAFVHMVVDSAGSIAVVVAGISALAWKAFWVDPVASILIGIFVLWSAWGLLRDTTRVLMEGSPQYLDALEVESALASDEAVEAVHHLHLWNLASDVPALSAHVVFAKDSSLHEAQMEGDRLKSMLHHRFGIEHSTLELECHPCEPLHSASKD